MKTRTNRKYTWEKHFDAMEEQMKKDKEPRHTPTPWKVRQDDQQLLITGDYETIIARLDIWKNEGKKQMEANAAFVVRAVNSHEALIESIQGLLAIIKDDLPQLGNDLLEAEDAIIKKAENTIAQAEGE